MVVIAVSTKNHYSIIKRLIKNCKPKLILCEKPFCNSFDEALEISKICKSRKINFFVNYGRHCLPGVKKVKTMLQKNIIKTPIKGNVWFSRGFFNNGSHFIELLNNWIGPIKKINLIDNNFKITNRKKFVDFRIEFKKGTINFLENENTNYSHQSIELLSKDKRIFWDHHENLYIQKIINNKRYPKYKILDINSKKLIFIQVKYSGMFIMRFLKCLKNINIKFVKLMML